MTNNQNNFLLSYILYACFIVLFLSNIFSLINISTLAQNIQRTIIPVSTENVILDGSINNKEWKESSRINFSSPVTSNEYILIYLKYNVFDKSLDGAFVIPDNTPFMDIRQPDQIGFLFDIDGKKGNATDSTNHQIVFTRSLRGEYYLGNNSDPLYYQSVHNATDHREVLHTNDPLSNVTFHIISNNQNKTGWQGEFKIFFKEDPREYGFAISQVDSFLDDNSFLRYGFINYPGQNFTQTQIPSTWGNIVFQEIANYYKNIQSKCGDDFYYISQNKPLLLCGDAYPLSIEERSEQDISVSGSVYNILNGSRIQNGNMLINVTDSQGNIIKISDNMDKKEDGIFYYQFSDISSLEDGAYEIWVQYPQEDMAINIDLEVYPHIPTIDEILSQMGAYFALIGGLIGVIAVFPRIKSFFISKQQRIKTSETLVEINQIYDESNQLDKELGINRLKEKRDNVLTMLKDGIITEGQFGMLDQKISGYIDKINA